jgi:signal transduction histidine kinase
VVRSALDNLLSNAVRFSPDGERVVITGRNEGHAVRVDVTDRGPGIRPEHQSAIFDGVAAQRPVEDRRGGAGVGLSITRRLLRAAGGQIGVASQPGQGSTFWISVPRGDS